MSSAKIIYELLPILGLLAVIAVVIRRLPAPDLGGSVRHTRAFRTRRFLNWFPVGMTYAFLYMGRYNLNACKVALGDAMSKEQFAEIFMWGTVTYGFAFLINGPLTDRWGGRRTILIAALGSAAMNVAMGAALRVGVTRHLALVFSVLYAANMYFQSFGAVSIVKVNAAWFHLRERGTFGGIFGILISLGIYFAFDGGRIIAEHFSVPWVFFVPAGILGLFAIWDYLVVRDTPGEAGQSDFDTADATSGHKGPPDGVLAVGKRMFQNPVIVTIAAVEFCSGYLRNAIMQWYPIFAKDTGIATEFIPTHWGMLLCVSGILGGVVAGTVSDVFFQSRRGPVAAMLYALLVAGTLGLVATLGSPLLGLVMALMSLCIIGVHGMLSGTASMDFGGKRNVGVAVGIIDGLVYLGTALQSFVLGRALPHGAGATNALAWSNWPLAMLPATVAGFALALRLWNARAHPVGENALRGDEQPGKGGAGPDAGSIAEVAHRGGAGVGR